jgi:hypothetical protein
MHNPDADGPAVRRSISEMCLPIGTMAANWQKPCTQILQAPEETASHRAIAYYVRAGAYKIKGNNDHAFADYTREDPRVITYLDAENAYTNARLEPIIDELAAELKARATPEDVSVPAAYNGYFYERRLVQGAQYPLIVRWKDGSGTSRQRSCSMSVRLLAAVRINISLVHGRSARITSALPSRSISTVTGNFAYFVYRLVINELLSDRYPFATLLLLDATVAKGRSKPQIYFTIIFS